MTDIPSFSYDILWEERMIRSVANLTRKDGEAFLKLVADARIKTEIKLFQLYEANEALQQLREGKFTGAAVLVMPGSESFFHILIQIFSSLKVRS
jgi:propanol-preferring alcohol dehydrogenase